MNINEFLPGEEETTSTTEVIETTPADDVAIVKTKPAEQLDALADISDAVVEEGVVDQLKVSNETWQALVQHAVENKLQSRYLCAGVESFMERVSSHLGIDAMIETMSLESFGPDQGFGFLQQAIPSLESIGTKLATVKKNIVAFKRQIGIK